jgi:tellurite resistance protein
MQESKDQPGRDHLEIAFRSIECFSNDGKLSVNELQKLLDIALRDGRVDDEEKRVLRNIIKRLNVAELTPDMQEKVSAIRSQLNL